MEERILNLENNVKTLAESVHSLSIQLNKMITIIETQGDKLGKRLDIIESQLTDLKGDSTHTLVSLESGFIEIKEEIKKIGEVTAYESMYTNLKAI